MGLVLRIHTSFGGGTSAAWSSRAARTASAPKKISTTSTVIWRAAGSTPVMRTAYRPSASTGADPPTTRTPVTAKRSTAATWPPVETAMVSTVPAGAVKLTGTDQGVPLPPAGIGAERPIRPPVSDRTCTSRLSSTPVIRPPTVAGDDTRDP